MKDNLLITALIFIITGIIFGAFGAHALKEVISETKLSSFEVGIRYQIYQGLGLLVIGSMYDKINFNLAWFYRLASLGTILFSSSIYLLALGDNIDLSMKLIGPITPIGGSMIIFSWILFLINIIKHQKKTNS